MIKPKKPTAKALQSIETRARILEMSLKLFSERGFTGTSTRDIASAAGLNHGLIRYHFKDKENLWREAVNFLFERMNKEMSIPKEDNDLPEFEKLKNAIRRYVRYCAHYPEHARIMVQESINNSDRLKWAAETHIGPLHTIDAPFTKLCKELKIWPARSELSITYILVAACQTIFVLAEEVKHVRGVDVTQDKIIEEHAETIIDLFFNHRVPASDTGLSNNKNEP
jgi:TetR/AcrR family transcriptional regulator